MSAADPHPSAVTSRRSAQRSRRTARESRRTVLAALGANALVTLTKLAAGLFSRSPAMLAEAAHSLADTANQGFLLVSIALADREPTPEQPFGFARMRFLWTFMAAVGMFLAGSIFAVGYGLYELLSGGESDDYLLAYIGLAISLAAEGGSWLRAVSQTRDQAGHTELPLLRFIRESRDPNVKMVVVEDTAALIGIVLAGVGILADQLTGARTFDPLASIAIGLLLAGVAVWLGRDTSELLVGAAARPAERTALIEALEQSEAIDNVLEMLTMVLGPNSLLVAARVDFAEGLTDTEVEEASEAIDARLREIVPDVTEVFLDATTARPQLQDGAGPGEPRRDATEMSD